jgi:ABC-type sugar transport system ATPase subunit
LVDLVGVAKTYGPIQALVDASVRVSAGTVHAIVGENGAGKSTLVEILSGLVEPTHGSILVGGATADQRSLRQLVSVVHQELAVVPDLTVEENMMLGAGRCPRRKLLLASTLP